MNAKEYFRAKRLRGNLVFALSQERDESKWSELREQINTLSFEIDDFEAARNATDKQHFAEIKK